MNLANFFLRNNYFDRDQLFLGLDLGKKTSQLAVLSPNGNELANFAFSSTRENFIHLAKALRKQDQIAFEVSNPANAVMSIFKKDSKATTVLSNPLFTRSISKARVKSDREDARKLADLNRIKYLDTVWSPDDDTLRLRHLITDREALVNYRTRLKNQVHSVLARNLIEYEFSDLFGAAGREWLDSLLEADGLDPFEKDRVVFLLNEITRQTALTDDLDKLIASFIASRPVFSHQLDLLLSIPGVSLAVGATILAAIGDISRFGSKQKFACYFGLTQRVKQTGGKPPRIGKISKQGNAYARFMFVQAAEHFRKSPTIYKRMYQRIKKKKGHNVAIVAVARRLAEVIYSILTKNEEFIYARPRLTDEKRAAVRKLARDKAGLKLKRRATNVIIRGTALRGRELKEEIFKRATDEASKIRDLMRLGKRLSEVSPTGFNPSNPNHIDWQKLLKEVAKTYAAELAGKKKQIAAPA
ncbi:MAG: IS110 family transposase [Gammaproteobacteria bacterium]|nr:IS110 family transposase [Gammaproteobacteria bacterium]